MYKAGHAFTYLLRGRRPSARASDLRCSDDTNAIQRHELTRSNAST